MYNPSINNGLKGCSYKRWTDMGLADFSKPIPILNRKKPIIDLPLSIPIILNLTIPPIPVQIIHWYQYFSLAPIMITNADIFLWPILIKTRYWCFRQQTYQYRYRLSQYKADTDISISISVNRYIGLCLVPMKTGGSL